jgi:hypothetical protein
MTTLEIKVRKNKKTIVWYISSQKFVSSLPSLLNVTNKISAVTKKGKQRVDYIFDFLFTFIEYCSHRSNSVFFYRKRIRMNQFRLLMYEKYINTYIRNCIKHSPPL